MGYRDKFRSAIDGWRTGGYSQQDLETMQKAALQEMDLMKGEASHPMKALLEDPMGVLQAMQYKDKPFSLSYDLLRRMATKDAVVSSIITTRVNQVSTFTTPVRFNRSGVGYEIRMRDPQEKPSKEDKDVIQAIERFLEHTGYEKDNFRDDFDTFVRKIARDRLTYDQVCFEIVPDRVGRPAEYYAVDASTIRLASERSKEDARADGYSKKEAEEVKYVQVINGVVKAFFTANEMAFAVANPRTDIRINGYGLSELEMLMQQVTAHLWAEEYNTRYFSQGGTTKGVLNLKGNANAPITPHQLEAFKRQWISQVSGMTGAWKTPVVSVDGLEYINVSQSNREMEFEKWMNYLINIACAVYQIDPAEVNFPNRGGAGGSGGGGLGDGGIEDRLKHSRDKGLRPLLRFLENLINKHIVSRFGDDYVFAFVGLDQASEKEIVQLMGERVKTYKTVNEIRKEEGLPPLDGGDIILDNNFIMHLNNVAQMEMQKQQMEQQNQMMANQPQQGGPQPPVDPNAPDAGTSGDLSDVQPDDQGGGGQGNGKGSSKGSSDDSGGTTDTVPPTLGKSLSKSRVLEIEILE